MKRVVIFTLAMLVSCGVFANEQSSALGSVWRSQPTTTPTLKDPHDITIVYGGEDLSHRPTLSTHTIDL